MKKSSLLNVLYENEKIIIPALSGDKTIYGSEEVFKSFIDSDFENWGLNKKSKSTPETEVNIYEMVKNANFKEMFISLSDNLDSLCLTQSQIINFCEKHRNHLRQDVYATFFLTKKDFEKPATEDNLFVVDVHVSSVGLHVYVYHFDNAFVWDADDRHRVVVPKLS